MQFNEWSKNQDWLNPIIVNPKMADLKTIWDAALKNAFPVFDLLEDELANSATIKYQNEKWNLLDRDKISICSGESIRAMLIELIFLQTSGKE